MKRYLATFMVAFMTIFMVPAQDNNWIDNAPEGYLPNTTKIIVSRESPCNQGEEAFMDFIPKFRTDKEFRNSRLKFSGEMADVEANMFNLLADWNNGNGYALLKAIQKNTRCDKSYGTWFNVSADEVCFRYEEVLPCSEWGGSAMYARFQRIDGKWYCTGIIMAG
ncbi:MAG: hypothetical protein K2L83_06580 [Muribaculaceae bacterium]|nr:hypothetical protein [Muribaculaceae bacterium]